MLNGFIEKRQAIDLLILKINPIRLQQYKDTEP